VVCHQLDVHKQHIFCVSGPYWSPKPPLVHGLPDRNIFCVSDVFMRNTVRTFVNRAREGVFQTDDVVVGQGGGVSKKSVFARTSLTDDPLGILLLCTSCIVIFLL